MRVANNKNRKNKTKQNKRQNKDATVSGEAFHSEVNL